MSARNIASLDAPIRLFNGDYRQLLSVHRFPAGRRVVAFLAPPWAEGLSAERGLDLASTKPPIAEISQTSSAPTRMRPSSMSWRCTSALRQRHLPHYAPASSGQNLTSMIWPAPRGGTASCSGHVAGREVSARQRRLLGPSAAIHRPRDSYCARSGSCASVAWKRARGRWRLSGPMARSASRR
jgi:hypothetical protein